MEGISALRAMGIGDDLDDSRLQSILDSCHGNVDMAIDAVFAVGLMSEGAGEEEIILSQGLQSGGGGGGGGGGAVQPAGMHDVDSNSQGQYMQHHDHQAHVLSADEEIDEMTRVMLNMEPQASRREAAQPQAPAAERFIPPPYREPSMPPSSWGEVAAKAPSFTPPQPRPEGSRESGDGFQTVGSRKEQPRGGAGGWGRGGRGPTVRLVVMVGPPGCGKSTTSELFRRSGWIIVSQDELGSRQHCETAVFHALASQQRVVVDRTNIDQAQRSHWVGIARKLRLAEDSIACLSFNVPAGVCKERVMSRRGHRTLPSNQESMSVVDRFCRELVMPSEREGFGAVVVVRDSQDPKIMALASGYLP